MPSKKEQTKMDIAEAFIQLLKKKDFDAITNKDITDKAGFSHITIYRNFQNKKEILQFYLRSIFEDWHQHWDDEGNIGYQIFKFFEDHKEIIDLLYKANLQYFMIDHILELHDYKKEDPDVVAYSKVTVAYLIFGWCDEWYKRGMKNTPEEMAQYFQQNKTHS